MKNKAKTILLLAVVTLTACASPMSKKEVRNTDYQCDNVNRKIVSLQREKLVNNNRVLSGARSIIPVGVVVGIVRLNYLDHLSIATGSWAKTIDKKVDEMSEFKTTCA